MAQVCAGKLLYVHLGRERISEVPTDPALLEHYLLGSGLAAHLFSEALAAGLVPDDPLDPGNTLYVFNGLLTGTMVPTGCRSTWCARSPLTGMWGESNTGGHWGAQLRAAGYAGLILEGGAAHPVYLWIDGRAGTVEIRDARHLWGMDAFEAHDRIEGETDGRARIALIGPAGERLVRYASVMQGGATHSRAAGRTGMGAVMGAKRLKAIAVRGIARPTYPDPDRLRALVKRMNAMIRTKAAGMTLLGTSGGVLTAERFGALPLQNWREGSWPEGAEAITGQTMRDTIWVGNTYCYACPIGCGKAIAIEEGPYAGVRGEGPEYETLCGFGGNLLIDDLQAIARMNDLCNRLGLDTITTSGVLAFATEAYERGLITAADTGGIVLRWGDAGAAIAMIGAIARRDGIGDLLAEGSRVAADALGGAAYTAQVKGLELPYIDPRAFVDMALDYATANRGACHMEGPSYWRGYGMTWRGWQETPRDRFEGGETAAELVVAFQDYASVYNPLGLCKFLCKGGVAPAHVTALLNAAMGWSWTPEQLLATGRRIYDLKRRINVRLGVSRADDVLPERLRTEPRPSGAAAGHLPDMAPMLEAYYRLRGWDADGRPPDAERG
ncbi:MAG: aldehyde ferredoxin oxidoreductase family protein [Anaerolineae bacterium]|nr:aldehyde ferredoxin oxidoreductase family protein [Anaerolineae bacterium]